MNLCFLDVATEFPGSMHDSRVLRTISLFRQAENNEILKAPIKRLNNINIRPLILGDGGYPTRNWLLRPYSFTPILSREEKKFNYELSSARVTVERAFGILKARWRCLLTSLNSDFEDISDVIITCFVLQFLPITCRLLY